MQAKAAKVVRVFISGIVACASISQTNAEAPCVIVYTGKQAQLGNCQDHGPSEKCHIVLRVIRHTLV